MDHKKLVMIVSQCPPLWDRSHDKFRDQTFKAGLWNKIGIELSSTGPACREAFKALREKYIREREKSTHYGNSYRTWELLELMQFLDPYIITRKPSQPWGYSQVLDNITIKPDPSINGDEQLPEDLDMRNYESIHNATTNDFCRALVRLVYEARAVWDRHSKDYHDKQMKDHLWKSIAETLKSDVNTCALRWKGLREKYIRQKQKYSEGEPKWEFLDDLSFLDSVIQYRKKHWQIEESSNMFATSDNSCPLSQENSDYEILDDQTNDSVPNQPTSSTNAYHQSASGNNSVNSSNLSLKPYAPDSTLDRENRASKKRTLSDSSEPYYHKKDKSEIQERTPEQIFGELVAAMLAAKPEHEKNVAMMEIMSILAKPNA